MPWLTPRWSRAGHRPTCCASRSTPAARIRSACISRMWGTPSWATATTPSAAAGASPRPSGWPRSSSRRSPRASCCTRPCSRFPTRPRDSASCCVQNGPPICCRRSPERRPIRLCLLNATRCSILASSLRMSDAGVVRLLIFRVGHLLCATEAERVREILPRLAATRIPGAPAVVAGLVNVRGTLVTVVEGWRALRQPEPAASDVDGTTVLLEVDGGQALGFTVDEVVDLLAVGGDALESRQALPGIDPTLVRAVGRRAGQLFVVLDTDALLNPILSS